MSGLICWLLGHKMERFDSRGIQRNGIDREVWLNMRCARCGFIRNQRIYAEQAAMIREGRGAFDKKAADD